MPKIYTFGRYYTRVFLSYKCQKQTFYLYLNGNFVGAVTHVILLRCSSGTLGALHCTRLKTSHSGAICARSLTSKLVDLLRLIMCDDPTEGYGIFIENVPNYVNNNSQTRDKNGFLIRKIKKQVCNYLADLSHIFIKMFYSCSSQFLPVVTSTVIGTESLTAFSISSLTIREQSSAISERTSITSSS